MLELLSRGLVEEGGDCAAFRLASDEASYLPVDLQTQANPGDTEKVLYAVGLLLGHVLLWRKVSHRYLLLGHVSAL